MKNNKAPSQSAVFDQQSPDFYLDRLDKLPTEVAERFEVLKTLAAASPRFVITISRLSALLQIRFSYSGALECLKLSKLLDHFNLKLVPCYVIRDFTAERQLLITRKPDLAADPDVAFVQNLIARKPSVINIRDQAIIKRTNFKIACYNAFLRLFEALSINELHFDQNAVDNCRSLFKEVPLPQDALDYLEACLFYADNYGSPAADYSDEHLHYKSLGPEGNRLILSFMQRIFALSPDKSITLDGKNTLTLTALEGQTEKPKEQTAAAKKTQEPEDGESVDIKALSAQITKLCENAYADAKLPSTAIFTLRQALLRRPADFIFTDHLPFSLQAAANAKLLDFARQEGPIEVVASRFSSAAILPAVKVDRQGRVKADSPIPENELKAGLFTRLSSRFGSSYFDRFKFKDKIEQAFIYYAYYVLLLEPVFLGIKDEGRASELLELLEERGQLSHYDDLAFLAGLHYLVFCFDPTKNEAVPDYVYSALKRAPWLNYALLLSLATCGSGNYEKRFKELLILDLLRPCSQGLGADFKEGVEAGSPLVSLSKLNLGSSLTAKTVFKYLLPIFDQYFSRSFVKFEPLNLKKISEQLLLIPLTADFNTLPQDKAAALIFKNFCPLLRHCLSTPLNQALTQKLLCTLLDLRPHGQMLTVKLSEELKRAAALALAENAAALIYTNTALVMGFKYPTLLSCEPGASEMERARRDLLNNPFKSFVSECRLFDLERLPLKLRYPALQQIAKSLGFIMLPLSDSHLAFMEESTDYKVFALPREGLYAKNASADEERHFEDLLSFVQLLLFFTALNHNELPSSTALTSFFYKDCALLEKSQLKSFKTFIEALCSIADGLNRGMISKKLEERLSLLSSLSDAKAVLRSRPLMHPHLALFFLTKLKAPALFSAFGYLLEDLRIKAQENVIPNSLEEEESCALRAKAKSSLERTILDDLYLNRSSLRQGGEVREHIKRRSQYAGSNEIKPIFDFRRLSRENFVKRALGLLKPENQRLLKEFEHNPKVAEEILLSVNPELFIIAAQRDGISEGLKQLLSHAYGIVFPKTYHFNREKINEKIKESVEIREVIGELRDKAEAEQEQSLGISAPLEKPKSLDDPAKTAKNHSPQTSQDAASPLSKLSPELCGLIHALSVQHTDTMDLKEFDGLCLTNQLMSGEVAVEMLNDWCYAVFDEGLLDYVPSEGLVYIYTDILEQILNDDFPKR